MSWVKVEKMAQTQQEPPMSFCLPATSSSSPQPLGLLPTAPLRWWEPSCLGEELRKEERRQDGGAREERDDGADADLALTEDL